MHGNWSEVVGLERPIGLDLQLGTVVLGKEPRLIVFDGPPILDFLLEVETVVGLLASEHVTSSTSDKLGML